MKKYYEIKSMKGLCNLDYKLFSENKVALNIQGAEDKLSLLVSTTVLGSEIGITIIRGSNVLMLNKDQLFENGKMTELGLNMLAQILVPLRLMIKAKKVEHVKTLKGKTIHTIYNNTNCVTMTNRFGMKRQLKLISEAEIQACIKQIESFGMNTTEEEYDIFVEDFVNIVRALGESSIDVKKHRDRHYSKDINGFVDKGSLCVGNIKSGKGPKSLKSNLYDNSANVFASGTGYQMLLPDNFKCAFKDAIGDVKMVVKAELEDCVNERLAIVAGYNYDNYKKLFSNLHDKYPQTRKVLERAISLVRSYSTEYSSEFMTILRNSIYGTAKLEGMKQEDVYKLAVELCFLDNKGYYTKDLTRCVEVNKKLSACDKIFGDIAVYEYADSKLSVPLTVTDKPSDFEDGKVYDLEDGATDDFELCVLESYTGKATVVDGQLVVDYNPYDQIDDSYVVIPVDNFLPIAKDEAKVGSLVANKVNNIKALIDSKVSAVKVDKGISRLAVPKDGKGLIVGVVKSTIYDNLKLRSIELLSKKEEAYVDLRNFLYIAQMR